MTFAANHLIRRVHIGASALLAFIAVAHIALTRPMYGSWTPDAVWFLGTGMGLLPLAALNYSHIGIQPCQMPTTRLVRIANWIYVAFGVSAVWAVPEPQAFAVLACLGTQEVASRWTLPGPA